MASSLLWKPLQKAGCQRSCLLGKHMERGRVTCISPNLAHTENLGTESIHRKLMSALKSDLADPVDLF